MFIASQKYKLQQEIQINYLQENKSYNVKILNLYNVKKLYKIKIDFSNLRLYLFFPQTH